LMFTLLMAGCQYSDSKHLAATAGPEQSSAVQPGFATTGFAQVLTDIIAPKCLNCHSAAAGSRGGINLETYQNTLFYVRTGALKSSVETDFMPMRSAPLTAQQKKFLFDWIAAGAPENGVPSPNVGNPTTPPPSTGGGDPAPTPPPAAPTPGPTPMPPSPEPSPAPPHPGCDDRHHLIGIDGSIDRRGGHDDCDDDPSRRGDDNCCENHLEGTLI
jgi:hypothetical protein